MCVCVCVCVCLLCVCVYLCVCVCVCRKRGREYKGGEILKYEANLSIWKIDSAEHPTGCWLASKELGGGEAFVNRGRTD